jgi:hypothetical protein
VLWTGGGPGETGGGTYSALEEGSVDKRELRRRFCRRDWEAEIPITDPVLRREYNIPVAVA